MLSGSLKVKIFVRFAVPTHLITNLTYGLAWLRPARKNLGSIRTCAQPRLRIPKLTYLIITLYSNIYTRASSGAIIARNDSSQHQGASPVSFLIRNIPNAFSKTGNSSLSLLLVAVAQLFHQIFVFFGYLFLPACVCMYTPWLCIDYLTAFSYNSKHIQFISYFYANFRFYMVYKPLKTIQYAYKGSEYKKPEK